MIRALLVAGVAVITVSAAACVTAIEKDAAVPAGSRAAAPASKEAAPSTQSVRWEEVRSVIASRICVVADPRMPKGYRAALGDPAACGITPQGSLEMAVDEAFGEHNPLLVEVEDVFSVTPANYEAAFLPETGSERNRVLAEAYLSQDRFLPTLAPRIQQVFRERGLRCPDCPTFPAPPRRPVRWSEFYLYLKRYFVTDFRRFKEAPANSPKFGLVADGHLVDDTTVAHPEPQLMRAAWVTIVATPEILARTSGYVQTITREDAFRKAATDDDRAVYMQKSFMDRLRDDEGLQGAVCSTLTKYVDSLGVELEECGERSASLREPSPDRSRLASRGSSR